MNHQRTPPKRGLVVVSLISCLIEWLSPADLIIHETNVGLHTPYEKLAALPKHLRDKMRLNHYPDDFNLDSSAIAPLRQGQVYEV